MYINYWALGLRWVAVHYTYIVLIDIIDLVHPVIMMWVHKLPLTDSHKCWRTNQCACIYCTILVNLIALSVTHHRPILTDNANNIFLDFSRFWRFVGQINKKVTWWWIGQICTVTSSDYMIIFFLLMTSLTKSSNLLSCMQPVYCKCWALASRWSFILTRPVQDWAIPQWMVSISLCSK